MRRRMLSHLGHRGHLSPQPPLALLLLLLASCATLACAGAASTGRDPRPVRMLGRGWPCGAPPHPSCARLEQAEAQSRRALAEPQSQTLPQPRAYAHWREAHLDHVATMAALTHADVIFFGDSLTEGWLETMFVENHIRSCEGALAEFRGMSRAVRAEFLNFAFGGDEVENVRWRVENGELPTDVSVGAVVLCVGINDLLTVSEAPGDVAREVTALVGEITSKHPETRVLLLGLMPGAVGPTLDPDPAIAVANDFLRREVSALPGAQVTFLDCSPFLLDSEGRMVPQYYADTVHYTVHYTVEGYRAWRKCIQPVLAQLV